MGFKLPTAHCVLTWKKRMGEHSRISFIRVLMPFMRVLLYDLITFQRPTPNTVTLEVRISTYEFGGHKHSVHCR